MPSSRKKSDGPDPVQRPRIVVIGGGTGTFTVLSGLKKYPVDLTAIVSMADDGGSTGRLRDEYGVLPPGDIRQCLVALSEASDVMRRLFNYRFENGGLGGHSFGNLFLSALEKMTGDFNKALSMAAEVLKVRGRVVPVTLDRVHLQIELANGKKLGSEHDIANYQMISRFGVRRIYLDKKAKANPEALRAIRDADMIIIGPGSFYESLIPNLLVEHVSAAIRRSSGKKLFVCNLMNKYGHTDGFTLLNLVEKLEKFIKKDAFDHIVYNTEFPSQMQLKKYVDEGEPVYLGRDDEARLGARFVPSRLLRNKIPQQKKGDTVVRTLIRHDPDKLARAIMSLIQP